jgi:Beta-ketoacyl synthase, N-terminal domain
MTNEGIRFSIASSAAWAPGVETPDAWLAWANGEISFTGGREPAVQAMAPMLRRCASLLSKMALEVAYQCLGKRIDVPTIFCSRHGEAVGSVDLLLDLANGVPLSPTSFGLSVHNAAAGLFSSARVDHAGSIALAAGKSSVEHAVIEPADYFPRMNRKCCWVFMTALCLRSTARFKIAMNSPMPGLG